MGHPHQEIKYVADEFGVAEKPSKEVGIYENEGGARKDKPLKPARSQAELTRVRQGYLLISINCLNVCLTALVVLKTFGVI